MTLDRADLAVLLVLVGVAVTVATLWLLSPVLVALAAGVGLIAVGVRNLQ